MTRALQRPGQRPRPAGAPAPAVSPAPAPAPAVSPVHAPLREADLALIRRWLAADPAATGAAPQPGAWPSAGAAPQPGAWPTAGAWPPAAYIRRAGQPGADEPLPFGRPGEEAWARRRLALRPWGSSGACPGSCHSVNEGFRRQAAARAEQARQAERQAAWAAMPGQQASADLAAQAGTLQEDIQATELAAASLRLQLFEQALQSAQAPAGARLLPAATAVPTPAMRDAWVAAQQATLVLEALMRASDDPLPDPVAAPLRAAYQAYYGSLEEALAAVEAEERRRVLTLPEIRPIATCPTHACHGALDPLPQSRLPAGVPARAPPAPRALPLDLAAQAPQSSAEGGYRSRRLRDALAAAGTASTHPAWRGVIGDFRWATSQMDDLLRARLREAGQGRDLIAQFDFHEQLLQRQREFQRAHPRALKVRAVFYPRHEFERRRDEQGVEREAARALPWQFYLVRTEVPSPYSREVPPDYEWQLHDITAPVRPDRTVRTRAKVGGALEALIRERHDPRPIEQMDPPPELFDELNHRDFFPKGVLHWQSPVSGTMFHKEMTAPRPFGEWLTLIGMGLVVVGSLVFAPMSTPMLIAVGLGTGLTVAGRAHRLNEMQAHGVARPSDVQRFYWDVGLDLVSALTLGLGKAVQAGRAAGATLRAGVGVERAYFVVRRAQISLDVVNVGIVSHDFVKQYRAIQDSGMSPEQKARALEELTLFSFATGALMIVPLRSGLRELAHRPTLHLQADPANPGRLVADLEPAALGEAAAHLRTRARADARIVGRTRYTHPDTGEAHSYALWSDGRITRCSEPTCLQLAESVVQRLDVLGDRMLADSRHAPALHDLAARARQLREEAERLAAGPAARLREREPSLLASARELEERMVRLERGVAQENLHVERRGRDEAQLRWGDEALAYDPAHYRWVRRSDGSLQFQRRHPAVPWLRFDPAQKKFVVERSLFVGVSDARLQELRDTSATRGFRIVATIDGVDELRRLRPASATARRPPEDWVLVRIDDRNLVQFYDEAIPHGTIFEFPDGSRAWRTPRNTIQTEGAVRAPIGRRGFEQSVPAQLRERPGGRTNEGVRLEHTGVPHERAHPRGQGTGFELFNHIPLAPTYVNQQLQARGIELYVSRLQAAHPELDFRLITEHQVFPRTRRQAWIDYRIDVVRQGQRKQLMTLRIGTDYANPARPAEVEMRSLTTSEDDLALLMSVDMDVARAQLEARIRAARRRR